MLIGIIGPIGSGKTTVAKYLCEKYNFVELAFATPLKQIAEILGFKNVYGTQLEKNQINSFWGVSDREFMQKFGTEVCLNYLPEQIPNMNNIWIKLFEKAYLENTNRNIVVSDVRFIDEYNKIIELGGFILTITPKTNSFNTAGNSLNSIADSTAGHTIDSMVHRSEFLSHSLNLVNNERSINITNYIGDYSNIEMLYNSIDNACVRFNSMC